MLGLGTYPDQLLLPRLQLPLVPLVAFNVVFDGVVLLLLPRGPVYGGYLLPSWVELAQGLQPKATPCE